MSSSSTRGSRKRQSPLGYMLSIINDPTADPERRDRMAICAAQYCHPRAANHPQGKKSMAARAAASAGAGTEWDGDLNFDVYRRQ